MAAKVKFHSVYALFCSERINPEQGRACKVVAGFLPLLQFHCDFVTSDQGNTEHYF